MSRRRRRSNDWWRAKALLEAALRSRLGESARIEIGRVRLVGKGICRRAYVAEVETPTDPSWSRPYVVLLPLADAEPELDLRTELEAKVLVGLAGCDPALRVPELIAVVEDEGRPVLVETAVAGIPLELRASRSPGGQPWQVVAGVAAAVHAVDAAWLKDLQGHPTRTSHATAALAVLEGVDEPLVREARAWAEEHLPPPTPSALLHGDLLGQNILLSFENRRPGLIDWERARLGDPAYDLAIVTRGHRGPFQVSGGLERLVDAYVAASGRQITAAEVHIHELCMVVRWYRQSLAGIPGHPPEIHLQQLRGIFHRATAR